MAISTGVQVKCPLCGYSHDDLEYKVTTKGIVYYICPNCDYWPKFGRKSKAMLEKMKLKFNKKENKLERLENAEKEENRNNQGIEAGNNNSNGRSETGGSSWSLFD